MRGMKPKWKQSETKGTNGKVNEYGKHFPLLFSHHEILHDSLHKYLDIIFVQIEDSGHIMFANRNV